uniref:Putative secreted protein n=1 Tax=Anopheles darlingi TaxID=43151 RepID=A0A2M4DEM4_ANODA
MEEGGRGGVVFFSFFGWRFGAGFSSTHYTVDAQQSVAVPSRALQFSLPSLVTDRCASEVWGLLWCCYR